MPWPNYQVKDLACMNRYWTTNNWLERTAGKYEAYGYKLGLGSKDNSQSTLSTSKLQTGERLWPLGSFHPNNVSIYLCF